MPATTPRDSLLLRVRRLDSSEPVRAQVRLDTLPWRVADSTGSIALALPRATTARLEVRNIGFEAARLSLRVPRDSGLVGMAVMAPMLLHFDDFCP